MKTRRFLIGLLSLLLVALACVLASCLVTGGLLVIAGRADGQFRIKPLVQQAGIGMFAKAVHERVLVSEDDR